MSLYYVAIVMTIAANVAYHLCSKKVEGQISPFVSLAATYGVAFLVCLVCAPIFGLEGGWREHASRLNWASYTLGAAIVLLEVGFILAYRAGWNVSLAALYSNVAVGILLLPVGLFFFGESLSAKQVLGLVFSFFGLFLLSR